MICINILLFMFVCSIVHVIHGEEPNKSGELIFAHVLFRHGDRTPVDPYPNDPWKDPKYWSTGWGQLTNTGKQQHYELGQWLRRRYTNLVNQTYSKNEVYIRSTDVDRTLMSALSNLAGFYPPHGQEIWNDQINWQPIPVHTVPEKKDDILAAKKPCPAFDYALKKLKDSDEYRQLDQRLKPLYEYLTKYTGRETNSITGAQYIYSCLHIEDIYNRALPEWTKQVYPTPLNSISARSFQTNTYTPELARLKVGPLLKEIFTRFVNKTVGKLNPDRSLWIYSAHDTTVANLLNALGLFEPHNPPYTACILMELRKINGNPFVQIFYKNTTAEPEALNIPNCGTLCPLDKVLDTYKPILPVDWEQECQMSMLSMTYVEVDMQSTFGIFGLALLVMLSLLVLMTALIFYRRRSFQDDKWYYRIDG